MTAWVFVHVELQVIIHNADTNFLQIKKIVLLLLQYLMNISVGTGVENSTR